MSEHVGKVLSLPRKSGGSIQELRPLSQTRVGRSESLVAKLGENCQFQERPKPRKVGWSGFWDETLLALMIEI